MKILIELGKIALGAVLASIGFLIKQWLNKRQSKRAELQRLHGLLEKGKTIYKDIGGQLWEQDYDPQDPVHKRQLEVFVQHNNRISDQIERVFVSPYPDAVKSFFKHANHLQTVVQQGQT